MESIAAKASGASSSAEKEGHGNPGERRILYCHCAFSRVVPEEVKSEVLAGLASSGQAFDAVPDLCELAARQDPDLQRLAAGSGPVEIVACYPRAVRWLFHAAEAPLPDAGVRIHNMRAEDSGSILEQVFSGDPQSDGQDGPKKEEEA
jgi:hypothetical protein